jgi:uncharacterized protein (DUF2336 family)
VTAVARIAPVPSAIAPSAADLMALAHSRAVDDRQRLLLGVLSLCETNPPEGLSPVLEEIFLTLARQAERDMRQVLSTRLAEADWAPAALVHMLALDEIEIARPVIAGSPLLKDEELIRLLVEASLDHQVEVARRPRLSGRVSDVIIERGEPATLTALAGNSTADVSAEGMRRLVDHSRRVAALRLPLTRHPRMNEALATQMYMWVGSALRQAIGERFEVDETRLAAAVEEAATAVIPGHPRGAVAGEPINAERDEMERRLVDKLHASGQLRAGFLVRATREKRLSLFRHALATLSGFTVSEVDAALRHDSPEALYCACVSVGIDRAVFPALIHEIRQLNGGLPGHSGGEVWNRGPAMPAQAAQRAFRTLLRAPGKSAV